MYVFACAHGSRCADAESPTVIYLKRGGRQAPMRKWLLADLLSCEATHKQQQAVSST